MFKRMNTNNYNTTRLVWVDYMKAFSIMAVVLYHTQIMDEIRNFVYLVCLPAFFFTAGMFTNTELSLKAFFIRKTLRLFIPYLIWGILTYIFWFFILPQFNGSIQRDIKWWQPLLGMLYGRCDVLYHNVPLWFLCCMISLEWIYYAIHSFSKQWIRWLLIALAGILGCTLAYLGFNWIWGISAALIILPIYAIGAEYKLFFKEKVPTLNTYLLVGILCISIAGIVLGYIYNSDIRLCESIIGNPYLYYLTALSAVCLWLSLSLLIEKCSDKTIHVLQYIGKNTLIILCTHISMFSIIKGIGLLCHIPIPFFATTIGH